MRSLINKYTVSIQPSAVSRQPCGTGFGLGLKATLREWPRCANDALEVTQHYSNAYLFYSNAVRVACA
ncbi:MAG: hypothetical protein F6K26_18945 [Moorea sp. SIO2I5]|nr:hypothetical protein [Moorena sp. SIO2I5]